jgi:hypothetical protein
VEGDTYKKKGEKFVHSKICAHILRREKKLGQFSLAKEHKCNKKELVSKKIDSLSPA